METKYDVIVVGAGIGGICAAIASARCGAKTLLIEAAPEIGGTGVHSPVSLVCKFHARNHQPINMGIHRELFFENYKYSTWDKRAHMPRHTYDEHVLLARYYELINAEPLLELRKATRVAEVQSEAGKISCVTLESGEMLRATVFVDGTADGNLAAMAGCSFQKGREVDNAMQSATLVFTMTKIDKSKLKIPEFNTRGGLHSLWAELSALYKVAKAEGKTANPKSGVLCFGYPNGERLLFNSNEMVGVDPTEIDTVEKAKAVGKQMIDELVAIIKQHPAFEHAEVDFVASKLGVREGRRIVGDYMLTMEDCLGEARFDDMVAACSYEIDIHDPEGGDAKMIDIPGSGYYHIPYRCLLSVDSENLLVGSRCISGTHEAHSSYRVMSGVSAIGQAAGTAAALASRFQSGIVRQVKAKSLRFVLQEQLQFVEGETEKPEGWDSAFS